MKEFLFRKTLLIFACCFLPFAATGKNDGERYTKNSVLSAGNWYKIKIGSTGIYKLTYSDLQGMGISNPANVRIHGYGGYALSEDFTTEYIDDLPQVAIWMSKPRSEFGSGDYILFYGKGDIKWEYNQSKGEFMQTQHPYSVDSYYFVTESEEGPLLMNEKSSLGTANEEVTSFTDYYLHENELINIEETGRDYFGENFMTTKSRNFSVNLSGIASETAILNYRFIARPPSGAAYLDVSNNGVTVARNTISAVTSSSLFATTVDQSYTVDNFAESNTLNFTYTQGNASDKNVYLDYIRINFLRSLKPYGAVTLFRSTNKNERLGFRISETSGSFVVFDVTDALNPEAVQSSLSGSQLSFTASNTEIREYALVNTASNSIPVPEIVGKIENQNLHALEMKEMIIIVRPFLKAYAEQLAEIHREDSGLESLIVTADDIYNEFSSGKPDITAYRRFVKMFYDRADGDETKMPKYLLLFGDGTFDNRFLAYNWTETHKNSMLLTYQTTNSISEAASYTTDDYIGFLEDKSLSLVNDDLNIAIGRITVRDESEARAVVNKIKKYLSNEEKGIWKNNIAFFADDLIGNSATDMETQHLTNSEGCAEFIENKYPHLIVNKIYQDSYERVVTPDGARYPDARKALLDKINSGLTVLNYTGHGSTSSWAHEAILLKSDVLNMTNSRQGLWVTATCDYSRFDGYETSAGEYALLNANGGAIALFSTSRVVWGGPNADMVEGIFENVFEKEDNKPLRLGDVLLRAKKGLKNPSSFSNGNVLRFFLLGDPALRISLPDETYQLKITGINGIPAGEGDIQIKALASNVLNGVVVDMEGNTVNGFSGNIESVIFDSKMTFTSRGQTPSGINERGQVDYTDYINTIYTGSTTVENGAFSFNFVTPKDILYTDDYGKMSFYAYDKTTGMEAQGSYLDYVVGGIDETAVEENNPPVITDMYLNGKGFTSGDKVNSTPTFYAEVYEDTGFNFSSGIGHQMSLVVDGITSYTLNNYFENLETTGSGVAGKISFTLPELEEGKHNLQFRIWDVWNNSETAGLEFEVVDNYKPDIYDFRILGNPAKDYVRFVFSSDVSGSDIKVTYEVYSMTGALQWAHEETGTADFTYEWDIRAGNGRRLAPGMYICRLFVTIDGKVKASKSEKLIVTGQ